MLHFDIENCWIQKNIFLAIKSYFSDQLNQVFFSKLKIESTNFEYKNSKYEYFLSYSHQNQSQSEWNLIL